MKKNDINPLEVRYFLIPGVIGPDIDIRENSECTGASMYFGQGNFQGYTRSHYYMQRGATKNDDGATEVFTIWPDIDFLVDGLFKSETTAYIQQALPLTSKLCYQYVLLQENKLSISEVDAIMYPGRVLDPNKRHYLLSVPVLTPMRVTSDILACHEGDKDAIHAATAKLIEYSIAIYNELSADKLNKVINYLGLE